MVAAPRSAPSYLCDRPLSVTSAFFLFCFLLTEVGLIFVVPIVLLFGLFAFSLLLFGFLLAEIGPVLGFSARPASWFVTHVETPMVGALASNQRPNSQRSPS